MEKRTPNINVKDKSSPNILPKELLPDNKTLATRISILLLIKL
jgi:hypothetical protein